MEMAFRDPEQERSQGGHEDLSVVSRMDEADKKGRQHVGGSTEQRGDPRTSDGSYPTEEEESGEQDVENELPAQCAMRSGEEEKKERGRIQ